MLVSDNVLSVLFFYLVFLGEVCESLFQGRGELNALFVHPALNVFSHSLNYAFKCPPCNRKMEQSKAFYYFFLVWRLCAPVTVEEKKKCFCSGGNYISVYSKLEALLRLGALYLFSGELYCNKFTLIFHYPYEPSEISNWLIMLNQNELSYATGLFAAL